MKIVAIIFLAVMIISKIWEVFCFGKERRPLTPTIWLIGLIINLPAYWIFWEVATN